MFVCFLSFCFCFVCCFILALPCFCLFFKACMPRVLHGDGSRANPGKDMECTGLGRGGWVVVTPSNPEPGARSPLSLLLSSVRPGPARCHRKPGDEACHIARASPPPARPPPPHGCAQPAAGARDWSPGTRRTLRGAAFVFSGFRLFQRLTRRN